MCPRRTPARPMIYAKIKKVRASKIFLIPCRESQKNILITAGITEKNMLKVKIILHILHVFRFPTCKISFPHKYNVFPAFLKKRILHVNPYI